jgi:TonB family protein
MLTSPVARLSCALLLMALIFCSASTTSAESTAAGALNASQASAEPAAAPGALPPIDPSTSATLDTLALQVVHKLPKHVGKILVLDFAAITSVPSPLGEWLGDQFTLALGRKDPRLQFLNRADVAPNIRTGDFSYVGSKGNSSPKSEPGALCKQTGADTIVIGTYGPAENGVGLSVTLGCISSKDAFKFGLVSPRIKLALKPDDSALLLNSFAALQPADGIYKPNAGGVTVPNCLRCPPPRYPLNGNQPVRSGVVYFTAVVSARGQISDLKLVQGAGSDLEAAATAAVRSWQLSPAVDIDGKPVAVRTTIEVSFKFF